MKMRLLLLGILIFSLRLPAADIEKADLLFEKKLYDEALRIYQDILKDSDSADKEKALFRAAESEALLFRYGEAAKRIFSEGLPTETKQKARRLFLRAELGRMYLDQYSAYAPDEREKESQDITRKSKAEWEDEIRSSYSTLWKIRNELFEMELKDDTYFFDTRDSDLDRIPTLGDLLVLRLAENQRSAGKKPAKNTFAYPSDVDAIFDEGTKHKSSIRKTAQDLWEIEKWFAKDDAGQKISVDTVDSFASRIDSLSTPRGRAKAQVDIAEKYSALKAFDKAVTLCRENEKSYAQFETYLRCRHLQLSITLPQIQLKADVADPSQHRALLVNSRNVSKLHFRAFVTTPDELKAFSPRRSRDDWSHLRALDSEAISRFLEKAPLHRFTHTPSYPAPYETSESRPELPDLKKGLWVILASHDDAFSLGKSLVQGTILNVTDFVLIGSQFQINRGVSPHYRFYSVNAVTGAPEPKVSIDAISRVNWQQALRNQLVTSEAAMADLELKTNAKDSAQVLLDPLATRGNTFSLWPSPLYHYLVPEKEARVQVDSDRPIYRPGQTAKFRITVIEPEARGYHFPKKGSNVQFSLRDPNGTILIKKSLSLGAMGTTVFEYRIPSGKLLGSYYASADFKFRGKTQSGGTSLSIEEFKRPEFEIELTPSKKSWPFGQKAEVQGTAKYYFGGSTQGARISYKITREHFIPYFCWYWLGRGFNSQSDLVAQGSSTTDENGNFRFEFIPEPSENLTDKSIPARFVIDVEATDLSGRTIKQSRHYMASQNPDLFRVTFPNGYYVENEPVRVDAALVTLENERQAGAGRFRLVTLSNHHAKPGNNLDESFSHIPDGEEIKTGALSFSENKDSVIQLGNQKEGIYRLHLITGRLDQSFTLIVSGKSPRNLGVPELTLPRKQTVSVGDTAEILLGSSSLGEKTLVETWIGDNLVKSEWTQGGNQIYRVSVTEHHQLGFAIRWFGVSKYKLFRGEVFIDVPWKDRSLEVVWKGPARITPGGSLEGTLEVRDGQGHLIDGEALFQVYDRSLESFTGKPTNWVNELYPKHGMPKREGFSLFTGEYTSFPLVQGALEKLAGMSETAKTVTTAKRLPGLRSQRSQVHRGYYVRNMEMSDGEGAVPLSAAATAEKSLAPPLADLAKAPGTQGSAAPRSNFSETAVFLPQLKVERGTAHVKAQMPENLSSWRVLATVLSKQVGAGRTESSFTTAKDLMIRVEIPRFLREGDKAEITTVVHNETDSPLSGDVRLKVLEKEKLALEKVGLNKSVQNFKVPAHAQAGLTWKLTAPKELTEFSVIAEAKTPRHSDAESRKLPVYPGRERLVSTKVIALEGAKSTEIQISLPDGSDFEKALFQVEPQLISTVLGALPSLTESSHPCTESLLYRYVPLAIMSRLFELNPHLKEIAKKLPRHKTTTPPWEKSDPRRLTELAETPWAGTALGATSATPSHSLLDAAEVKSLAEKTLAKLKERQNPDGGLSWMPGGHSDPYISLMALVYFVDASEFGVALPEEFAKSLTKYLLVHIPKPTTEISDLSTIAMASYALSGLAKFAWAKDGVERSKKCLTELEPHSDALTPYGKALIANAFFNLGDKAKANGYLDRLLDGLREDDVTGAYWTPEKNSWVWYRDTLEGHATGLRTLLKVRPDDRRVGSLMKWLLFNRKGTEWRSPRASTSALFSIFQAMKLNRSLDGRQIFVTQFGGKTAKSTIDANTVLSKPLRWEFPSSNKDNPKTLVAKIQKEGGGLSFSSLSVLFSTDVAPASGQGDILSLERKIFRRTYDNEGAILSPMNGSAFKPGDTIEVHHVIKARSGVEYLHLRVPKPAGLEFVNELSGWTWDALARYFEPRDTAANFYLPWTPHGEYLLKLQLKATTKGHYRWMPSRLQSLYSPDLASFSAAGEIRIEP